MRELLPHFLAYLYSFATVAIMWANHHHLLKGASHPGPRLLWSNNNLLFWISLVPFVTAYMADFPFQAVPVALYGACLTMCGVGFAHLRDSILRQRHRTRHEVSAFQWQLLRKNIISALAYAVGGALAFVDVRLSFVIFIGIPLTYFIPDPTLELEPKR